MIMQTKAGSSCLAQTPQLSAHIPLTFSPKFKCEVRNTRALISRKIKKKIKKKKIKRISHAISKEVTNRTKGKIYNFSK